MRLLSAQTVSALLTEQRRSGRRFASLLGGDPEVDEARLTKAIAAKLGLETVALDATTVHERVLALLPGTMARQYGVLPLAVKRVGSHEVLYLVMQDPLDAEAVTDVQRLTKRQVRVLMAPPSEIDRAVESCYTSRGRRDSLGRLRGGTGTGELPAIEPQVVKPQDFEDPNESATRVEVGVFRAPAGAPADNADPLAAPTDIGTRRSSDIPLSYALEIPVEWEETDSPFDGPNLGQVQVGLEHTGIMPAVDLDHPEFDPPPLEATDTDPRLSSGDIPLSTVEAAARTQPGSVTAPDAEAASRASSSQRPAARAPSTAPRAAVRAPEPVTKVTPPSRPSPSSRPGPAGGRGRSPAVQGRSGPTLDLSTRRASEGAPQERVEGGTQSLAETKPEAGSRPVLAVDDTFLQPELTSTTTVGPSTRGASAPRQERPRPRGARPAEAPPRRAAPTQNRAPDVVEQLVEDLSRGALLTASHRGHLVLAIGRLLLSKGILTREELVQALRAQRTKK